MSLRSVVRDLADQLPPVTDDTTPLRLRWAKVVATPGGSVVTLQIGGSTTNIPNVKYLASYTPAVNDIVAVLQAGPDLLIIGEKG